MKVKRNEPPRTYAVGKHNDIKISDCAHINLLPDEQVTFQTEQGSEYDVARKSWGYYATPSLNARLPGHGFTPLLVRSIADEKYFVFLLEQGCGAELESYLEEQGLEILCSLDQENLQKIGSLCS